MIDDRPIKPNQEYLDKYIEKVVTQIEKKEYLKKKK